MFQSWNLFQGINWALKDQTSRFVSSMISYVPTQETPMMFGKNFSLNPLRFRDRLTSNSLALKLLHLCCHTICTLSKSLKWCHSCKTSARKTRANVLRWTNMLNTALKTYLTSYLNLMWASKISSPLGLQRSETCLISHQRISWLFISQMTLTTPIQEWESSGSMALRLACLELLRRLSTESCSKNIQPLLMSGWLFSMTCIHHLNPYRCQSRLRSPRPSD